MEWKARIWSEYLVCYAKRHGKPPQTSEEGSDHLRYLSEYLTQLGSAPPPPEPKGKKTCLENLLRANTVPNAVTHAILLDLHLQLAEMAGQ